MRHRGWLGARRALRELSVERISSEGKAMTTAFDDHLDICEQCEKHPFDLCPVGDMLLRLTVDEVARATLKAHGIEL